MTRLGRPQAYALGDRAWGLWVSIGTQINLAVATRLQLRLRGRLWTELGYSREPCVEHLRGALPRRNL